MIMKNKFWLPVFLALGALAAGCGKDENSACSKNVSVTAVQPNTNPAGHEVLLKTSGFSSAAKVVFGTVAATSRAGGESGDIIAKVPAGVSGNVEISVEEGDCIARSGGFIVSGGLPTDVQPSLPVIVVPTPTTTPSTNIPNFWPNAANQNAGISLQGSFVGQVFTLDPFDPSTGAGAQEFDFNNTYFNNNPVKGTLNTSTNVVYLEVDRTAKGGGVEHFDGEFIVMPPGLLPANATQAILLVSRETGRQLLLYYPN